MLEYQKRKSTVNGQMKRTKNKRRGDSISPLLSCSRYVDRQYTPQLRADSSYQGCLCPERAPQLDLPFQLPSARQQNINGNLIRSFVIIKFFKKNKCGFILQNWRMKKVNTIWSISSIIDSVCCTNIGTSPLSSSSSASMMVQSSDSLGLGIRWTGFSVSC